MGFSRQEYWSGLQFPSPGQLPDPGIEPASLATLALTNGFLIAQQPQSGKPLNGRTFPNSLQSPPAGLKPRRGQDKPMTWHRCVSLTRLHTHKTSSYSNSKTAFLPQNETEHKTSGCLVRAGDAAVEQDPRLRLGLPVPGRGKSLGQGPPVTPPSPPASKFIAKFVTKLVLFDAKQSEVKQGLGLLTARRQVRTTSFQNALAKPKD